MDAVRESVAQLFRQLDSSSKIEIESTQKSNEILKLKTVLNEVAIQNQKLHERIITLSGDNETLVKNRLYLLDEVKHLKQ